MEKPPDLNMNVCIVEDSIPIQERLKRMIEQLPGMNIAAIAGDLNNAEQMLLQDETELAPECQIQVVVLDTQLPDGNSLELLKKIKLTRPQIKVVVFSNHASEEGRVLAQRAGADGFLDKSADSELLMQVLQNWQHNFFESTTRK